MAVLMLFGTFVGLVLIGVPIAFSMLGASLFHMYMSGKLFLLQSQLLTVYAASEQFYLIAVPLFIFAGEIMSKGGAGSRIIEFATLLFRWVRGGLTLVAVSGAMVFAGISGSAVADTAAIGSTLAPGFQKKGYSKGFTAALLAAAGTIGIIIPPSIPMIIFGYIGGVSILDLFVAGVLPGVLFGILLMIIGVREARLTNCDPSETMPGASEVLRSLLSSLPALMMPVIILGGIFAGVFTPTEAAAAASVYGIVVSTIIYRDVPLSELPKIIYSSFSASAAVLLVVCAASGMTWVSTLDGVPQKVLSLVTDHAGTKVAFLIAVNVILLILGCLVDTVSAMIITVPLLMPIAKGLGIDPVHFGIIFTVNLAIGMFTPPVGVTLFIASRITGATVGDTIRRQTPIYFFSIILLLIVTFVPELSLTLGRLVE